MHYSEEFPASLLLLGPLAHLEGALQALQSIEHFEVFLLNTLVLSSSGWFIDGMLGL